MEIRLILTAFLVSSGRTIDARSNKQANEAVTNAKDEGLGIQKYFSNLFQSIITEDKEKTETYRTILQQEAGKEQQMFNTMREELQSARPRRAHEQESLQNRSRRATVYRYSGRTAIRDLKPGVNPANTSTMEDEFNAHFGNTNTYRQWREARLLYMEDDEPLMKKFCREAHRLAGKGSYPVDWMVMTNSVIKFENPEYVPKNVDVLEYGIYVQSGSETTKATTRWAYREVGDKWQITAGVRHDCVYYLNIESRSGPAGRNRTYSLKEQVCGIKIVDDTGRIYFL